MEQTIYTSCTLDCPDGCGIIAHVKDGRVVKLEGHPDHNRVCHDRWHAGDYRVSSLDLLESESFRNGWRAL